MKDSLNSESRIPCLDGIRAFSILFVVLAHLPGTKGLEVSAGAARSLNLGSLGVRIFFVISGFLITTLLLAEHRKYGTISLSRFYFRRAFRIFPAFYVFIACILVAEALGWVSLREHDLLHAATYTTNYHHNRAWELGHLWSLAVEEQFYLLWPALFLLFGTRGAIGVAAAYMCIAPLVRVVTWKLVPADIEGIGESFQTVADSIATGCVLAALRPWMTQQPILARMQSSRLVPAALLVLIFAVYYVRGSIRFSYVVGETMLNVFIALFIDWCLRNPMSRLGRLLDWAPIAFVGTLSYSLYLWQQPFVNRHSNALVTSFPLNLICAFGCALASYYLVEKPCLSWRSALGESWLPKR
jgi:peptidoglycan/LPS O-acetylase OafA/YrhL